MELVMILVLLGALAVLVAPRIMRRRGIPGEQAVGTLLVTGVSPKPDVAGEQFVTITGVINGPTVNEHVVYQRMAVDVDNWPRIGDLIPVVYSPNNPDNWRFAPPDPPPPAS
ncbi:hypothetical protein C731_1450 [Mycolicibacterium hassiacum DSM 44199]|jgi:hypothetical protein|uniref:Uncharacterized protein n=1 Tax=Mycolicibacterium hassiacum (strain DSM 44199 / CIP 105218 / JCM 12690 / 3849) TaxID=1122247 RepID=K5BBS8_MYCHD|nr:hypothetical protein [Mycolicibacterium hassiacum]EKF24515.1 hypothetical protein C731_1450 [Mycolicibacterium hassiacum DSM 44199]MBX5488753.1 hypothetical protein [Mycolicibacterium hassiacum]MDA4084363.1 hypothetical protein [Mycolicibacterium hassiacum DSM 44199]PZN18486.1 MAG: hypothetical protein DIU75_16930 [Mycolicibacterium hassiacum]